MNNELTVQADIKNVAVVTEFVDAILEQCDCSMKAQMQIDVAIDELFSNIAYYAYGDSSGQATVRVELDEQLQMVTITFIDDGVPYNPLIKEDPDITLSIDERETGGLGIFMVKKTMDDIRYEYINNQNVLKIMKKL